MYALYDKGQRYDNVYADTKVLRGGRYMMKEIMGFTVSRTITYIMYVKDGIK